MATPTKVATAMTNVSWGPSKSIVNRAVRFFRLQRRRTDGDRELIDLVLKRLDAISPAAHAFARAEFAQQLFNFDDEELIWSTTQYAFTGTLALLGILGTVSAALGTSEDTWKTVAIIAGALVAALTALNQAWSPSGTAATFKLGYAELRSEGWDYLNWLGSYKPLRPPHSGGSPSVLVVAAGSGASGSPSPAPTAKPPNGPVDAYDTFAERIKTITKRTAATSRKEGD